MVRRGDGKTAGGSLEAAVVHGSRQAVGDADERGDERVRRLEIDLARRADLGDRALAHHHDAITQSQRLGLVVGHIDGGDGEAPQQRVDLRP